MEFIQNNEWINAPQATPAGALPLRKVMCFLLTSMVFMLLYGFAKTPAAMDMALVSALEGKATVRMAGSTHALIPYSKLEANEQIHVPEGSVVQIVYFSSGTQETWRGSSKFQIGHHQSLLTSGRAPQTSRVSLLLARQLMGTPQQAGKRGRIGQVRLRSVSLIEQSKIESEYARLKAIQPAGIYLAELFKLNALNDLYEYELMEGFIDEIRRAYPVSRQISELSARFLGSIDNQMRIAALRDSPEKFLE